MNSTIAISGNAHHSEFSVGIIMLKTSFPRLKGDIGNPETFRYKAQYEVVDLATVDSVVTSSKIDEAVFEGIVAAAKRLECRGVKAIATSCGFLAPIQARIQDQIKTPFVASSLNIIPLMNTIFGIHNDIGILTFDQSKLSPLHFNGHYRTGLHIQDIDKEGAFYQAIKFDKRELSYQEAENDVLNSAKKLVDKHKNLSCIILECTNLSPYKNEIKRITQKPVFDIVEILDWLFKASSDG
ncbi:hypothetical protein ACGK9R_11510 [Halomonas sp. HNIBRBA4712]|uniref:hypothetical protein n=1 Tax=Halomonas sp. HNIBRBA4712 TaxID=3373087 RepID=UPI0037457A04